MVDVAGALPARRFGLKRIVAAGAMLAGIAVFVALGIWQLERRVWKLDLIARVDQRVHAAAIAAPGPDQWPALTAENAEYRHVLLKGRFLDQPQTPVLAVTTLGRGFWVMAPMRTDAGFVVLVNRGFIPSDQRRRLAGPDNGPAEVTITGLLRMSEPGGAFLHSNDPADGRWYSRDVAAIAASQGLGTVAPYFVDADATPDAGAWPEGGLTVVTFRNAHLQYALTWFALALGLAAMALRAVIAGRRWAH
jgi:surfeit locus 1 family protein